MDLFNDTTNILPFDGEVNYYGPIMNIKNAQSYFEKLLYTIAWKHDQAIINDKVIITKRQIAWYADSASEYTYSKTTKRALPWTETLLELKHIVEHKTGETFNSCLLNLYSNGEESMGWHSDEQTETNKSDAIASLSFGAERKFYFKHKTTKQKVGIALDKGSLIVMQGQTQTHWLHSLPPSKKVKTPRINLTFRIT